jgi:ectoine hydroxylase-related dioxygenase (phytanoyl-CoA dioxygenase family)
MTCDSVTNQTQRTQYQHEGYTVVRDLIPAAELKAVRNLMVDLLENNEDWPKGHFQVLDQALYKNRKGGFIPLGIQCPAQRSEVFRNIADHPALQTAMSELLGGAVVRHTDQALVKSIHIKEAQGGATFYHQDSFYWRVEPRLGCNAWIALDEVGKDEIALAIIPGSHASWTLEPHESYFDDPKPCNALNGKPYQRHRIPFDKVDYSKEVLLPMKPGDAAFFTNFTWHRAESNKSGVNKCAYAVAYKLADPVGSGPA